MTAQDKVFDRLKKLMNHEDSAREIGSVDEAEAFAGKISELLLTHKLSRSEVELAEGSADEDKIGMWFFYPEEHDLKSKGKRALWQARLGMAIAQFHFCRYLVVTGSNHAYFVGRKSDSTVAIWLYGYLIGIIDKEVNREYDRLMKQLRRQGQNVGVMQGWRESFRLSAVTSLRSRFKAIRAQVVNTTSKNALIIVAEAAVTAWYDAPGDDGKSKFSSTQKLSGRRGFNPHGASSGKKFGREVSLNRAVEGNDRNVLN